jgi:hypothetical protein
VHRASGGYAGLVSSLANNGGNSATFGTWKYFDISETGTISDTERSRGGAAFAEVWEPAGNGYMLVNGRTSERKYLHFWLLHHWLPGSSAPLTLSSAAVGGH